MATPSYLNLRGSLASQVKATVDELLRGARDVVHVLIGPILVDRSTERPYLILVSGNEEVYWAVRIDCLNTDQGEMFRGALLPELIARRPLIIHDFDDDEKMKDWTEMIWPMGPVKKLPQ